MKPSIFRSKSEKNFSAATIPSSPRLPQIAIAGSGRLSLIRRSIPRKPLAETQELRPFGSQAVYLSLSDFIILRTIGTGSFARVRLAINRSTREVVVLKSMSKSLILRRKQVAHVLAEKALLGKLASPFLLTLKGAFQDTNSLHLALEFVQGGELYHLLAQRGYIERCDARIYAAEIVCALSYLHSQSVVYRDLKPENILITATGHLKLADFGFAKQLNPQEKTYTLCGTPEYLSPEVILNTGHDFRCDWWTLGVLLYEMLTGSTPFKGSSSYLLYQSILTQQVEFPAEMESNARILIAILLCKDPDNRATELEIRSSAYFANISWKAVVKRQLIPSYIPKIRNALDASHFDKYVESEEVREECRATDQYIFKDF